MSSEQRTAVLTDAAERPAVEGGARPAELEEDLRRLFALLAESDVEGARSLVKDLVERWPEAELVQHYGRVLAPPRTRVVHGKRGRSMGREFAWLKVHMGEYPGQWVAIYEDRLIAADPDLSVVLATVRQTPGAEGALLHQMPNPRR